MKVCIAVITYQRPEGLARLLNGLARLAVPEEVALEIVVVDNDPEGSAKAVCAAQDPMLAWPLRVAVEPNRGIPFARNRAVQEAAHADFIAFIDDDEVPAPGWLSELIRVQRTYQADIVGGPVLPVFPDKTAPWLIKGGFFERPRYPTGHRLDLFATNNVLLCTRMLRAVEGPFDEHLAFSGGSDTLLALRLRKRGCMTVWADEACVYEWQPPSRLNARWVLHRAFRLGNTASFTEAYCGAGRVQKLHRMLRGIRLVVQGLLTLPVKALQGRHGLIGAIRTSCFGVGELAGLLGLRYREYRQVHGS